MCQLRLHRITTFVHSGNQASLNMVRRLGFREEGRMRESCFFEGSYHDVLVVGLLAREWESLRSTLSAELDDGIRLQIGPDGQWSWPLQ